MDDITKNLSRYIFLLLIAGMAFSAEAGVDLHITIKQQGSGVVVEGATVVFDQGLYYAETGADGRVSFSNVAMPKHIKVLAAGYETLLISEISKQSEFTLYLIPVFIEAEGLEVLVDRIVEKTSKIGLTRTELVKAAGSGGDPLKGISALPGIVSAEDGASQIYMRGSNGNENITWINNAPVGYLYHFGGFYSVVPPSLVKDINVFLAGFPVEYGDALGGVIDTQLRVPKSDRMHYKVDISTITASFLVEGPLSEAGGDSYFIGGRRSYIDLLFSPEQFSEDEGEENPDQVLLVPRFYDFQALYHHKLKRGSLDSYVFTAGDKFEFSPVASAKSDPQFAGDFKNKIEFQTAGITWRQQWNNQWDSIATAAVYHTKNVFKVGTDAQGQAFFANTEESLFHLQPELRWRVNTDTRLNLGILAAYGRLPLDIYLSRLPRLDDSGNFNLTEQNKYRVKQVLSIRELSPYIKYRQQISQRLSAQIGLRYSNIDISSGYKTRKLSPRSSLEYRFSPETLLLANWGVYIQRPATDQVVNGYSNPRLRVTESEHRILGIEHQVNKLYSIKAEIYQKPMRNLVIPVDENLAPDNYANEGSGEAYGFDLFIKRRPSRGKFGWLSLSIAKSTRRNQLTGVTRDFSGDQPLTLSAVWGQPFTSNNWKRWEWSIRFQAHSGKPYTAVVGRHRDPSDTYWVPEYGENNAERLPTFYKLDYRIGKEVLYRETTLKFYFDIQNVTFANNVVEVDYGYEYEKIDNPTQISEGGFFPFFGVEWEF